MDLKRYNEKTDAAYKELLKNIEHLTMLAVELQLYKKEADEMSDKTALSNIDSKVRISHECVRYAGILLNGGQE